MDLYQTYTLFVWGGLPEWVIKQSVNLKIDCYSFNRSAVKLYQHPIIYIPGPLKKSAPIESLKKEGLVFTDWFTCMHHISRYHILPN